MVSLRDLRRGITRRFEPARQQLSQQERLVREQQAKAKSIQDALEAKRREIGQAVGNLSTQQAIRSVRTQQGLVDRTKVLEQLLGARKQITEKESQVSTAQSQLSSAQQAISKSQTDLAKAEHLAQKNLEPPSLSSAEPEGAIGTVAGGGFLVKTDTGVVRVYPSTTLEGGTRFTAVIPETKVNIPSLPASTPTKVQQIAGKTIFSEEALTIPAISRVIPGAPSFTMGDIQRKTQQSSNVFVRGAGRLIPTTPLDAGVILGLGGLSRIPGVSSAISFILGTVGVKEVATADTTEEKVAGGIVGTLGILGLASSIKPKVDVRFLSRPSATSDINKVVFVAEQKTPLSTRTFLGGAETKITSPGKDVFVGGARGVLREFGRDLLTGKVVFRAPSSFGVAEFGRLTPKEINLLLKKGQITVRSPLGNGFTTISAGATKTPGGKTQFFISRGGGGTLQGRNVFISRSRDVVKTKKNIKVKGEKGQELGVIEETPVAEEFVIVGNSALSQSQIASLSQQRALTSQAVKAILTARAQQRAGQVQTLVSSAGGGAFGPSIFFNPKPQTTLSTQTQTPSTIKTQTRQARQEVKLQSQSKEIIENLGLTTEQKQNVALASKQIQQQQQKQRQRTIGQLGITQPQRLSQQQRLSLLQVQLAQQVQKQKQRTQQIQISEQVQVSELTTKIVPGELARHKALTSALKKVKGSLDVHVGIPGESKTKVIGKRLPPFLALKKGRDFVADNLSASFKLKKNAKKPTRKDIPPFKLGKMFRPGKRDLFRVVEKRKYRLDTPAERKQIQASRRKRRSIKI